MLKHTLIKLDEQVCKAFLQDRIEGWGYIIDKAVKNILVSAGSFYCITANTLDLKEVNELTFAKGFGADFSPNSDEIIWRFSEEYLNNDSIGKREIILEDYNANTGLEYFKDKNLEYYLANSIVFYRLQSGTGQQTIRKYFREADGPYTFSIIYIDIPLGQLEVKQNIGDDVIKIAIDNICCFVTSIYDGESYLLWVKDGYKLLDVLKDYLV